MAQSAASRIPAILKTHEKELLAEWMKQQLAALTLRSDLLKEADLREQSRTFLDLRPGSFAENPRSMTSAARDGRG